MDTQHSSHVSDSDALENKADELIRLMLSFCEEEIREVAAMPDARASALANAAMSAQNAIHTFLALTRIR